MRRLGPASTLTGACYALSFTIGYREQEDGVAKRYYTPGEVASELSVSVSTVLRLVHDGYLPAVRVSERIYRIPVPAFERFQSGAAEPVVTVKEHGRDHPRIGSGEPMPRQRRLPAAVR